jgi:hypothetical protein
MKKITEFFSNDFERSYLGKMHRASSHTRLANVCAAIFRLKRYFESKNSLLPPGLWLMGHMHEFVQQRYVDMSKEKSVDDLLQLMLDAVHSDKVLIVLFHKC